MPLVSGVLEQLQARACLKQGIRHFFSHRGYIEVDTPVLVPCPGSEVHLGYFATQWRDAWGKVHPLWLRSSPELSMKVLLAQGAQQIFQIAPSFRNDGELADWHHPEFSLLEWYSTGTDDQDLMIDTFALLHETNELFLRQGKGLALPKDLTGLSVTEAFERWAGIDLQDQDPDLWHKAQRAGVLSVTPGEDFETSFFKILFERVEPALKSLKVCALYDYPPSQAALAKVHQGFAKRVEFYVDGIELSNGFWELVSLQENKQRFLDMMLARGRLNKPVPQMDPGFFEALTLGIPPCAGNAFGVDRWLCLLMQQKALSHHNPWTYMYQRPS